MAQTEDEDISLKMNMEKTIYNDMVASMKAGDVIKRDTLRLLLSEIKNEHIDSRKELTDADIIKIIKTGLKKRQEAIQLFRQGSRDDLVDKTQKEMDILSCYMPKQLTGSELEKIVAEAIAALGKNQGLLMKEIMSKYGSQTDGKTVQQIVARQLSQTS